MRGSGGGKDGEDLASEGRAKGRKERYGLRMENKKIRKGKKIKGDPVSRGKR